MTAARPVAPGRGLGAGAALAAAQAGVLLLAGCGGGEGGCQALLANGSGEPVEQVYLAPAGAPGWGPDLLAQGDLAPGASLPLRFAGRGPQGMRVVWSNGAAVEMRGIAACRITRLTLTEGGLRAE